MPVAPSPGACQCRRPGTQRSDPDLQIDSASFARRSPRRPPPSGQSPFTDQVAARVLTTSGLAGGHTEQATEASRGAPRCPQDVDVLHSGWGRPGDEGGGGLDPLDQPGTRVRRHRGEPGDPHRRGRSLQHVRAACGTPPQRTGRRPRGGEKNARFVGDRRLALARARRKSSSAGVVIRTPSGGLHGAGPGGSACSGRPSGSAGRPHLAVSPAVVGVNERPVRSPSGGGADGVGPERGLLVVGGGVVLVGGGRRGESGGGGDQETVDPLVVAGVGEVGGRRW